MSQKEKLLARLLSRPKDFTYNEARTLLGGLGYYEDTKGKTSGSRVVFVQVETLFTIYLHKPHPGNVLKLGYIDEIIEGLRLNGDIE